MKFLKKLLFSFFLLLPAIGMSALPQVSKQEVEMAIERVIRGEVAADELQLNWRHILAGEVSTVLGLNSGELANIDDSYVLALSVENAKPGVEYVLLARDCSGSFENLGLYKVDEVGVLCHWDKNHHPSLDQELIYHPAFFPGEAMDYLLVSMDGTQIAAAHILPKPLEITGDGQEKVTLEMRCGQGKTFKFYLSSFQPNVSFVYLVDIGGHEIKGVGKTSAKGEAAVVVPIDKEGVGAASLVVKADYQKLPLVLHFQCGEALLQSVAIKDAAQTG